MRPHRQFGYLRLNWIARARKESQEPLSFSVGSDRVADRTFPRRFADYRRGELFPGALCFGAGFSERISFFSYRLSAASSAGSRPGNGMIDPWLESARSSRVSCWRIFTLHLLPRCQPGLFLLASQPSTFFLLPLAPRSWELHSNNPALRGHGESADSSSHSEPYGPCFSRLLPPNRTRAA